MKYLFSFRREKDGHGDYERIFIHPDQPYGPRYVAVKVAAGRWRVNGISQQDRWSICYWNDVQSFEVKPGQITFVGELDAQAGLNRLQDIALRRGNGESAGQMFVYWDDELPPPLNVNADLNDAKRFVSASMPRVTGTFANPQFQTVRKERTPNKWC